MIFITMTALFWTVSVQWKRLPTGNESPPARAYHSMTHIGSRYLLFGGFDGKSSYSLLWWLVPEDDPIAKRMHAPPPNNFSDSKDVPVKNDSLRSALKESQKEESPISELQKRLEILVSSSYEPHIIQEFDDKELLDLSLKLSRVPKHEVCVQVVRDHWMNCTPSSILLRELGPSLHDYKRLITHHHLGNDGSDSVPTITGASEQPIYRFYHIRSASELRMDDIPNLLTEYKQLLSS